MVFLLRDMSWKSLLFTTLFSLILFIALVSLGMKFHWVDLYYHGNDKQVITESREQIISASIDSPEPQTNDDNQLSAHPNFKAVVVKSNGAESPLTSMTKQQVIVYCENQYKNRGHARQAFEIAVGNCVMTHYQSPHQEINRSRNH